ncbi:hypothetical protein EOM39_06690 [Candidatus Gracilibacteria bacterium]|nr:hypothetical protein [Candidatus Gracilibacteria bacterium]
MEYKDRAKSRKIKRQLIQTIDLVKLKGLNLSISKKIVLAGVIVGFFSLFMNWIDSTSTTSTNVGSSFSDLAGRTGITLLILQLLIIFVIFSKKNKEKLKLSIDSHIKDFSLIIIAGVFTIVVSINALNFISGLQTFSSDTIYGAGVISEICSGIMITAGGILLRREFYKNLNKVYVNESEDETVLENSSDDNNMSLPF